MCYLIRWTQFMTTRFAVNAGLVAIATCLLGGCGDAAPDSVEPDTSTVSADQLLREMIRTYRQATSYSDRGVVRFRYRMDGHWVQDEARLSVKFARPNKVRLRAYQLAMASDGTNMRAMISDPGTVNLDGQVLVRPAPEELQSDALYDDPMVLNVMAGGMGGPPAPLELLLDDKPLQQVFEPRVERELLGHEEIRGRRCERVKVTLDTGALIFWIDTESRVLRRLEYPTDGLVDRMADSANCSEMMLTAEFRDARINGPIDESEFRFEIPAGVKLVTRFVVPPQPLPTELFGELPNDFSFTDLSSEQVARDSLLGKVAVLVWFNDHPASEMGLAQVNEVYGKYADEPHLSFHAVCTVPTVVGNDHIRRLAQRWGVDFPVVRDVEAFGRDVFAIPFAPTTVVLDPRGVVQVFEVGCNPDLAKQLPDMLRQLLDGEDLAAKIVAQFETERSAYEKALLESAVPAAQDARAGGRKLR